MATTTTTTDLQVGTQLSAPTTAWPADFEFILISFPQLSFPVEGEGFSPPAQDRLPH